MARDPLDCVRRCDTLQIAKARIATTVEGEVIREQMRTVHLRAGGSMTVQWHMIDDQGRSIDLTTCQGESSESSLPLDLTVKLRMLDAALTNEDPEFDGFVSDYDEGLVGATVDTMITGPGLFRSEFAVLDEFGVLLTSNVFYILVEPSLFLNSPYPGPPSMAAIRLHMRDSSPAENRLTDNYAWTDSEIVAAIQRPVEYWNEIPPPIGIIHTTQTFPYRFHWMEAISGLLMLQMVGSGMRNSFGYSAGGIQIEDSNKWQAYEEYGQRRWQTFQEFVRSKKVEINIGMGWGSFGSPYGHY